MWMYIALICSDGPVCSALRPIHRALLDIRFLLCGVNRWARAIVSADLRFQATAAVTSTGKRPEKVSIQKLFPSTRLDRAFCSFDGDNKQLPIKITKSLHLYNLPHIVKPLSPPRLVGVCLRDVIDSILKYLLY